MYKDKEAQKEANREKARRHRERAKGVTQGVTEAEGVTEPVKAEGVTRAEGVTVGVTRINPVTKLPYGKGMLGLMATPQGMAALAEYERKHGQLAPVYGTGSPSAWLAQYAISEKFERIHQSLGQYAGEVRVGCFGPTVEELYETTH